MSMTAWGLWRCSDTVRTLPMQAYPPRTCMHSSESPFLATEGTQSSPPVGRADAVPGLAMVETVDSTKVTWQA